MKSIKFSQIFTAIFFVIVGIVFLVMSLKATLSPGYTNPDLRLWFGFGAFMALWIDISQYLLRKSFQIDSSKLVGTGRTNFLSTAAQSIGLLAVILDIVKVTLAVLVMTAIGIFVYKNIPGSPQFVWTGQFKSVLLGMAIYVAILRFIFIVIGKFLTKATNKNIPLVTIENNSFVVDLKIKQLFAQNPRKFIVQISFDELEEVRNLSFFEADALSKYVVGPDLSLAAASIRDMYKYMKEEIPRPNYYFSVLGQNNLFVRGQNVCYLISVGNSNVEELVSQFKSYKGNS